MATLRRLTDEERTNVTRIYGTEELRSIFMEAFERVGGVDRLVAYASQNKNYPEFLKLLVKFAPKDIPQHATGVVLEYKSLVPSSPLNRQLEYAQAVEGELVDPNDE